MLNHGRSERPTPETTTESPKGADTDVTIVVAPALPARAPQATQRALTSNNPPRERRRAECIAPPSLELPQRSERDRQGHEREMNADARLVAFITCLLL